VFATLALLIAAIGIYGVLAYSVNQRTREIGVRMALGATPARVLKLIVGEGMKVILAGVAVGLAGGLALGRAVSSLVFGVTVRDPATFGVVAVALTSVALAACAIPARRASIPWWPCAMNDHGRDRRIFDVERLNQDQRNPPGAILAHALV
jgi:ABC-type antimicrobial peptide transport system permease subunit